MIRAATARLEAAADTVFVETNFLITMDRFPIMDKNEWWDGVRDGAISEMMSPARSIIFPIGPLLSVTSFKTVGDDGTVYTATLSDYVVDLVGNRGRFSLKMGGVWPTTILAPTNGVQFEVVAGMVATADTANLPHEIKLAIQEFVASMYEHRGDEFPEIPATALMLIEPYRRFKV